MLLSYKGYNLKSKTEFYWARFFEQQRLPWEYEPVAFRLGRTSYTPDFALNNRAFFVEIKVWGANVENKIHLCDSPLLIIFGSPARHYIRFKPARSTVIERGHFLHWNLAYQRAVA